MSERTKLIGVAVIAFLAGSFFGGRGTETAGGRYVAYGLNEARPGLLDTRTGQVWAFDPSRGKFERWASIPYF